MKNLLFLLLLGLTGPVWGQLKINSGATLTLSGSPLIRLQNTGFENNGTFDAGTGKVELTGTSSTATSSVGGASTTTFYDLAVGKSTNDVQLNASIGVNNELVFNTGNLQLNGFDVTLGSNGLLVAESETKRVVGTAGGVVKTTRTLNAPSALNPGNLGLTLTSAANLGSTLIARGHVPQLIQNESGIQRYFLVTPSNNSGLNATVQVKYFDAELNGLTESSLVLFQKTGTTWVNWGKNAHNTTANTLSQTGLGNLALLTLAQPTALPVEWVSFAATLNNQEEVVDLVWQVANERDVEGYRVERSADGVHFLTLQQVDYTPAASVGTRTYTTVDAQPLSGANYYRIRQVDHDGAFSFSPLRVVEWRATSLQLTPNPTSGRLQVALQGDEAPEMCQLFDATGAVVRQWVLENAGPTVTLDLNGLPAGTYVLQVLAGGRWWTERVVVE